jgi:Spy/CpxP family protein refolding chaperone
MKYKVSLILIIILLFLPLNVFSQSKKGLKPTKEEEIRRHIQIFRMWEMTKALDLTEEQATKIFPVLNRIEKEKGELNREITKEIRKLRELIEEVEEELDSNQIKKKLERIKELRKQIQEKDSEIEKLLEKNLTIEQQAKYIIFSIKFMKDLREKMDRARQLYRQKMMLKRKKREKEKLF